MAPQVPSAIDVLVVTHNRLEHLQKTLATILREPPERVARLIVVDNASSDGTADWLADQSDSRIERIRLDQNTGGAGGFSAGLERLRDAPGADWALLMDDDARPGPDAIATFLSRPRTEADVWFAAVRHPDGSVADMNRPWRNPFKSIRTLLKTATSGREGFHLGRAAYDGSQPVAVDGGSFVGVFFARSSLAKAPLPDPAMFLYGDDVLFTLRLSSVGVPMLFDPSIRFEHDCATMDADQFQSLWKAYFYYRNLILVYRQAAGPIAFWPAFALKWLGWRRRAKNYDGARRAHYIAVLRMAVSDGLAGRLERTLDDVRAFTSD